VLESLLPGGKLLEQSVMFPAPTYAGEPMRFEVSLTNLDDDEPEATQACQLEVKRISDGVVTCQGDARVLV